MVMSWLLMWNGVAVCYIRILKRVFLTLNPCDSQSWKLYAKVYEYLSPSLLTKMSITFSANKGSFTTSAKCLVLYQRERMIYRQFVLFGLVTSGRLKLNPTYRQNQTCTDLNLADLCQDICVERLGLCFRECSTNDVVCMSNCARLGLIMGRY